MLRKNIIFIAFWKYIVTDIWKFEKLYDSTETFLQCVRLVKWRFEAVKVRAERLLGLIIQTQAQYPNVTGIDDLEETIRVILDKVVQEISQDTQSSSTPFVVCESEGKGAPKYQISQQELELYVANGFTIKLIVEMLQVSSRTVMRRLHDFGIKLSGKFSVISEEELDREVELILVQFLNSGHKKMRGYLTSNGYNIQEYRVHESMRRVDPEGVMLRSLQSRPAVQRKYKIAGLFHCGIMMATINLLWKIRFFLLKYFT